MARYSPQSAARCASLITAATGALGAYRTAGCRGPMNRPLEAILGLAAAGGTAFLIAQVARYDMGMTGTAVRTGALSAAGLVVAAIAAGAMLKRR